MLAAEPVSREYIRVPVCGQWSCMQSKARHYQTHFLIPTVENRDATRVKFEHVSVKRVFYNKEATIIVDSALKSDMSNSENR